MPKRKRSRKTRPANKNAGPLGEVLSLYAKLADLKKDVAKVAEGGEQAEDRLMSLESHMNILARLLTTLCIEKFGMRVGVLKRLIKRIEKEAVRDSQIHHLETLYKLPAHSDKKGHPPSKNDPWEEIS